MRRLILMRHAKSDWNHPDLSDHDRPLNARGTLAAKALGDYLRAQGHVPDQILCSSAQRTRDTLLGLALAGDTPTVLSRDLYLADAQNMLRALCSATGNCVLMIAHNPGICELAHRLLNDPPLHDRFADYPTGSTLVCDFEADSWNAIGWHQGQPIDFTIPRELP